MLPALLNLGRAAAGIVRTTGAVAANTARTAGGMIGSAIGGMSRGIVGFGDVMKTGVQQSPASNVIQFKTGNNATPASKAARTPTATNAGLAGDVAAASELSMEELSNQTQILKAIQKNTGVTAKNTMAPPSAGGQALPPPSEEEIKKRLDSDDESKLAKLVGGLEKGLSSTLGQAILALGAALYVNQPEGGDNANESQSRLERMTGTGKGAKTNIFGKTEAETLHGSNLTFENITSYRFTADEKGRRVAGVEEQEANKEKKKQIMAMIGEGGDPADAQKLETAFREGNVKDIQAIEDKYRQAGQEGSQAYQYRASKAAFSQADAVSVGRRMGIDVGALKLGSASVEEKQKFIDEMYAEQQKFMKEYSDVVAGEGTNEARRAQLTGDKLFKSSRLENIVESQFDKEGRGFFFGKSDEEGVAFNKIKAELEGYRKSLKSSGIGEAAANNLVADELKKLEKFNADQMLEYTAPKVSGSVLEGVQTTASNEAAAATARTAARSAPAPAPAPQQPQQGEQTTISQGVTVNSKAHDDTAKVLKSMNNILVMSKF